MSTVVVLCAVDSEEEEESKCNIATVAPDIVDRSTKCMVERDTNSANYEASNSLKRACLLI